MSVTQARTEKVEWVEWREKYEGIFRGSKKNRNVMAVVVIKVVESFFYENFNYFDKLFRIKSSKESV